MDAVSPSETRKSRSKTPFLRLSSDETWSSANGEQIHEERIHEETSSVQVDNSTGQVIQNKIQSSQLKMQKVKSNFATVCSSPSVAKTHIIQSARTKINEKFNKGGNVNRSVFESSSKEKPSKSPSQKSGFTQKPKEIIENEINSSFEKSNMFTSTPLNSQYSSPTNGDLSSHIAYNEYREAGEYWNKFPKTDYTYSKLSRHRREIAPGVIAMPNMSRRSLMRHGERVNNMIEQNPSEEMFIRKRYASSNFEAKRNVQDSRDFYYDSQEEVDADETHNYRNILLSRNKTSNGTLLTRILSKFVTIFYSFIGLFSKSEESLHFTRIEKNEGIAGRIKSAITSCVLSVFRWLYICISTVLYVDTLVLRSISESKNKKRLLLFLLLLLPLLFLGGIYYYLNPFESFPSNFISDTSFPTVNLQFPEINISKIVYSETFSEMKKNAFEKIDDLKSWGEDYFRYLKIVSHNVLTEANKLWLENFNN